MTTFEDWYALANRYIKAGQAVEALDALEHAVALEPGDPNVWTRMVATCEYLGKTTRRDEAMARLREINPRMADELEARLQEVRAKSAK